MTIEEAAGAGLLPRTAAQTVRQISITLAPRRVEPVSVNSARDRSISGSRISDSPFLFCYRDNCNR